MRVYDFDPATHLSDVRTRLANDGFIQPDSDDLMQRFVALQSTKTDLEDALIAKSVENLVPIQGVLGAANQLILTNIVARHKPDLIGIQTTTFFNRYLSVGISLDTGDGAAQNSSIGAFTPYMLTSVQPTSKKVTGLYDNVCVVVDGSVVDFSIRSWGAVGFQMYIAPDAGAPIINDDLFCCFGRTPNQFMGTFINRYAAQKNTIQIVGTTDVGISTDEALRYQKVTFRTRRMTAYDQDGDHIESQNMPPVLAPPRTMKFAQHVVELDQTHNIQKALMKADSIGSLPGGSADPGTPVQGPPSTHDWGAPISNAVTDDPSNAMGEIVVYFFVFKSLEIAKKVVDGYNAPDPSLWT